MHQTTCKGIIITKAQKTRMNGSTHNENIQTTKYTQEYKTTEKLTLPTNKSTVNAPIKFPSHATKQMTTGATTFN